MDRIRPNRHEMTEHPVIRTTRADHQMPIVRQIITGHTNARRSVDDLTAIMALMIHIMMAGTMMVGTMNGHIKMGTMTTTWTE